MVWFFSKPKPTQAALRWQATGKVPLAGRRLLMCYGHTPYTPGRYLEDAVREAGAEVVRHSGTVPASVASEGPFDACVWVESPSQPRIEFEDLDQLPRPRLAWVHHGEHRVAENLDFLATFKPDLILMAHSLHLDHLFPAPMAFFPFGWDPKVFPSGKPWLQREFDMAFIGSGLSRHAKVYNGRQARIARIKQKLPDLKLRIEQKVYREELGAAYGNAKMVFNDFADVHRSINMRLWESMGCGSLLITQEAPYQDLLFTADEHYLAFNTKFSLIKKLKWAVANPLEAAAIAEQGHEWICQAHRYEHRVSLLFEWIDKLKT